MPPTYLSPHYHLVSGTKYHNPCIDAEWRERLHEYLGGTARGLGGFAQAVGGTADPVHVMVGL